MAYLTWSELKPYLNKFLTIDIYLKACEHGSRAIDDKNSYHLHLLLFAGTSLLILRHVLPQP